MKRWLHFLIVTVLFCCFTAGNGPAAEAFPKGESPVVGQIYYITGRKKRFVKVWGNRCNLDAVEQIVKQITSSCAVVGVDDQITVFVTKEGLEKEIKDLLASKTGLNSKAFAVRVIETMPVTPSGKIDYPQLQRMIYE